MRPLRRPRDPADPRPPGLIGGLNDEAIKNLGYMQMKKTHDAAMVLIERMYGTRPKYNYYKIGTLAGRARKRSLLRSVILAD